MSFKKFIALCLSIAFFTCSYIELPSSAESSVIINEGYISNSQKAGLYVNEETGEFTVTDENGCVWKSNPIFDGFDESASGLERTNQRSQILVQYLDEDKNINDTNNFIDSDRVVVEETKSGVKVVYVFSELGFIIPLNLSYKNGIFTASIDTSKINERYENKILNITVLPYFGAGKMGEKGYVFIPDGCGAIVSLEKSKAYIKKYQKNVFGENPVLYKASVKTVEEQIYLPVFGIKNGVSDIEYFEEMLNEEKLSSVKKVSKKILELYNQYKKHIGVWIFNGYSLTEAFAIKQAKSNKVGRNELCPCGSGKKFKKCCGK